ncbi:M16 family metallopeptidase [Novosphingobium colocasiae]|nr:insulinase family protein [Novosphingobium colocasiae]
MTRSPRAARSLVLSLPLLFVLPAATAEARAKPVASAPSKAQAPASSGAQVPWLYKGSDVPPDREWIFGRLPNGLRYAVRHNGVPPGQVSIRVRVDAGSLYEADSERGFAHLLEHMLFRQSKYIAEGSAITTFQKLGASFGSDTNAETTTTQTVFKLDLPDANAASLDEAMKLLSGMVSAPTLSAANLKSDLPIVLAEMRERGGASKRAQQAMQDTLYAGQPLSVREPIGTVETLTAATPEAVRAFYQRWYRPENVVVILSGDLPPAELEAAVTKWYAGWKGVGPLTPQPTFGDPVVHPAAVTADPAAPAGDPAAAPVDMARVLVEPDLPPSLLYAVERPWRQKNDTIVYNQGKMIDNLAQSIINRRLETKARAGGSFLTAQVNQDDVSRSADVTFVSLTPLTDDWQAALRDVRAVIADAMQRPPTQEEIDREVAELDVAFQVPVEQRRILPGSQLADDLVMALDIRETVASPEAVLDIFRRSRPLFTPQAVLEHTRKLFSGTVSRAVFTTPKAGMADAGALKLALQQQVAPDAPPTAVAAAPVSFDKLPAIGKVQTPAAQVQTGLLGIEEVVWPNGVKALLWPVVEEPGRVMVKVRFGGGTRAIDPADAPYIALGKIALVGSGLASLDQEDLDRISTGRKMGFDFDVDDASFHFSAETRPADLADQLYLFAGKLALPRWDQLPFQRAKAAARIQYATFSTSPQGVLNRDLSFYQRGKDARFATPTPEQTEAATFERFKKVWGDALGQGPVEVQIFGDFDKAAAITALNRTFGALPARAAQPAGPPPTRDVAVSKPSAQPVVLYHHGDPDQAAAVVSWPTGGGSMGISESRQLEILTQLFSNRLLDAAREKLGVSYSPYVYSSWPVDLKAGGAITAVAQVDPKSVPVFFQTASEIAQDLIDHPPSAEELALVTEPMRQQVTRAASSTAFFMNQLEGATTDPVRFGSIGTVLADYTETTPQAMQALAARYLGKGNSWRLEVLPAEGQGDGTTVASAKVTATP